MSPKQPSTTASGSGAPLESISEPQDPLDRLIEDIELQISLAPEGAVMTALQAQLDSLKRHRAARQLNEEPPPEA